MSTMDDLIDRIRETNDAIELSRENHEAIGLPDFVAKLEMNSFKQRLADIDRQQKEESVLNYQTHRKTPDLAMGIYSARR